jgi:hypothetical protein
MIIHGEAKLITAAYVKARSAMGATVTEDEKGNFGKYATLAAITKATTEPFFKNGLAIIQESELHEGGVTVSTWLVHESGATIEFAPLTMPLTDKRPQAVGSAITYARRYQLVSVCGLAPDDDDGQAAQDATKPTQPVKMQAQRQPAPAPEVEFKNKPEREEVDPNVPTDEELAILGKWQTPADAYAWAIEVKACDNEYNARMAFENVIKANGGRFTKANAGAIYLGFLRDRIAKLEGMKVAA